MTKILFPGFPWLFLNLIFNPLTFLTFPDFPWPHMKMIWFFLIFQTVATLLFDTWEYVFRYFSHPLLSFELGNQLKRYYLHPFFKNFTVKNEAGDSYKLDSYKEKRWFLSIHLTKNFLISFLLYKEIWS